MSLAMHLIGLLLKADTKYELDNAFHSLIVEGWYQVWTINKQYIW